MMSEGYCNHLIPKYGRVSKKIHAHINPPKYSFSGNFTKHHKSFDVLIPKEARMKRDLYGLGTVVDEIRPFRDMDESRSDNPIYEDPRDVIGSKPSKPPRKRVSESPRVKDKTLKEQKRKLTKKYEGLIVTLMDRCEENVNLLSEKEAHITKLKEKLKSVLEYNKLFADENDKLKLQYNTMLSYVEECKRVVRDLEISRDEMKERCEELEIRVKKYELPDRDYTESSAIPLVEVCISCSSRQILLNQVKEQNARLNKDMQALKDVLYRLNIQLSKYQERLRQNAQNLISDCKTDAFIHKPNSEAFDSLITASLIYKQDNESGDADRKTGEGTPSHNQTKLVDMSGLLSAQALAPLFDAYQDNIQEKETLIHDYEKQFENMNRKSKNLLSENKSLTERVNSLEEELVNVVKKERRLMVEKETVEIERRTLVERAEKAESKLKEVYELYEDKMATMMRDYETVHREYFATKNALAASEGKMARLDATIRDRTVPADLHERRVDHCKRLLEELKHQYGMENERKSEQLAKLHEEKVVLEEKYNNLVKEHDVCKEELKTALKNVKLYRKAATIFRQRVKASNASLTALRRSKRRRKHSNENLAQALSNLQRIKQEIKVVKSKAYTSLEELERRLVKQERRASIAEAEYRREMERAHLALQHKEDIIRSLIDKVADVEEVRLSQTNAHRLQGIASESSPERNSSKEEEGRKEGRLAPGNGGYFQERKIKGRK